MSIVGDLLKPIGDYLGVGDIGSSLADILGSQSFAQGLSSIGSGLLQSESANKGSRYNYDLGMAQLAWDREKYPEEAALRRELAAISAGAAVQAANISAGSADRRAKLAAIMDASGRRIDANTQGTAGGLSVIRDLLSAMK